MLSLPSSLKVVSVMKQILAFFYDWPKFHSMEDDKRGPKHNKHLEHFLNLLASD